MDSWMDWQREINEWGEEDLQSGENDKWWFVVDEVKEGWGDKEAEGSSSSRHLPAAGLANVRL